MKKVASGVIFEGYEFIAGIKYIYAVSSEYGKRNEKRVLTEEGKKAVKDIAKNTVYGDLQRHRKLGMVWHDEELSKDFL